MKRITIRKIRELLIKGDIAAISKQTGFNKDYVGRVLRGEKAITTRNLNIIRTALDLIKERRDLNREIENL